MLSEQVIQHIQSVKFIGLICLKHNLNASMYLYCYYECGYIPYELCVSASPHVGIFTIVQIQMLSTYVNMYPYAQIDIKSMAFILRCFTYLVTWCIRQFNLAVSLVMIIHGL